MAYENRLWENDTTPLNADNMNNIMEGINLALGYGQGQPIPRYPISMFKKGVGNYSIIGNDLEGNKAYGEYSTALGYGTSAGKYAFTAGRNNIAGYGAVAFGVGSRALADYSFAAGYSVTALGNSSISIGYGETIVPNSMYDMSKDEILDSWETIKYHIAKGYQSIALGNGCIALSTGSMALGANNASIGFFALASGCQTRAIGDYSATFGLRNVGNGRGAVVVGEDNAADGLCAFVGGANSNAHSFYGFAYGHNVHAYAPFSIAMGYESSAGMADKIITEYSNIFNEGANGKGAIALGWGADATYDFSAAIGTYVKTSAPSQVVFGKFNADNPDAVFIVGDGTSSNNKRNAFEVTSAGKAKVQSSTTSSDSDLTLATKDYVDDKQEIGEWTPQVKSNIDWMTIDSYNATYVKNGSQIELQFSITLSWEKVGTENNVFKFTGLPIVAEESLHHFLKSDVIFIDKITGLNYSNFYISSSGLSEFAFLCKEYQDYSKYTTQTVSDTLLKNYFGSSGKIGISGTATYTLFDF